MSHHFHAVVWIDQQRAKIFEFGTGGVERHAISAPAHDGAIHHKTGAPGAGHAAIDAAYLRAVADALTPVHEILIVGHGIAKTALAEYIRDRRPELAPRIMGVQSIDRQTEQEVVASARTFFDKLDRTTPQR